jgi:hypothetical protein
MRQETAPTRQEVVLKWAMGAALTLWAAYVFHSESNGQGIVGWVTDLAVQRFGTASADLCLGAAMLIGIPIGLVFRLIALALGIRLVHPFRRRRGELPAGTPSQIRRAAVLGAIGIVAAAALLTAITLPRNDGAPALPLDVDAPDAAVPANGARVAAIGTPRPELAAGYRETSSQTHRAKIFRYIPLTPKDWTPDRPVRFFLADTQSSDDASSQGIIAVADVDHRTRYDGRLRRNSLPTLARSALAGQSVRLAETYWVISNDTAQMMTWTLMIGAIGFALALALILTGMRDARRVAERDARRRPPPPPSQPVPPRPPGVFPSPQAPPGNQTRGQHPAPPRNRQATPPPVPVIAMRPRRPTPPPPPPSALRRRPV